MDAELQGLRRKGAATIVRLQEKAKRIHHKSLAALPGNNHDGEDASSPGDPLGPDEEQRRQAAAAAATADQVAAIHCDHVRVRLNEVQTIYNEVDRAAKRLEQLTEQRRECLREMTRQRALEEEINDVSGGERARAAMGLILIMRLYSISNWKIDTLSVRGL